MDLWEFSWHPILPGSVADVGMHLRRGGPTGETYAAVTVMPGEPWLAILDLHRDSTRVRSIACSDEMAAIEAVEKWLEGVLGVE